MFKVGQKVVCLNSAGWKSSVTYKSGIGPSKGEILEIIETEMYCGELYLAFKKYGDQGYSSKNFRPLDYAFVEEVIKQVQPEKQPA